MDKERKLLIGLIAFTSVLLILVIGFFAFLFAGSAANKDDYDKHIQKAKNYIGDLEYELAIAELEEAIEIDEKQEDAYLLLSDVYVELEDYDKAVTVLEDGKEAIGEENLSDEYVEKMAEYQELQGEKSANKTDDIQTKSDDIEVEPNTKEVVYKTYTDDERISIFNEMIKYSCEFPALINVVKDTDAMTKELVCTFAMDTLDFGESQFVGDYYRAVFSEEDVKEAIRNYFGIEVAPLKDVLPLPSEEAIYAQQDGKAYKALGDFGADYHTMRITDTVEKDITIPTYDVTVIYYVFSDDVNASDMDKIGPDDAISTKYCEMKYTFEQNDDSKFGFYITNFSMHYLD